MIITRSKKVKRQKRGSVFSAIHPYTPRPQVEVPSRPPFIPNRQPALGVSPYDMLLDPGITNPPIIYEPPPTLSRGLPIIYIIATGGGEHWGGCQVWLSNDGSSYRFEDIIYRGARQGQLTTPLPYMPDPDDPGTFGVTIALSGPGLELLSGSVADKDNFVTLSLIDNELISYQTAVLTSTFTYTLSILRRGCYGSGVAAHNIGASFARIVPSQVLEYQYPISYISQIVYIKLLSFNEYGQALQDISEVDAYQHLVTGASIQTIGPPPTLPGGGGWSVVSPISGDTITTGTIQRGVTLTPAGLLATLIINLPTSPQDGQTFDIESTQTINALTVVSPDQTVDGAGPITIIANSGISFRYDTSTLTWYRRW